MEDIRNDIKNIAIVKSFKAGSTILFQGEIPRRGFFILEGFIKVYSISDAGEENTVFIGAPGSLLPVSWLIDAADIALFNYEAYEDCVLYSFDKDEYHQILEKNKDHYKYLLEQTSKNFSASLLHVASLEQTHAEDKIAHLLYYLIFQHSHGKTSDTMLTLPFPISHKCIASLAGLTRESTTKVMIRLKKLGIVSYDRNSLEINKSRLEKHIGEDTLVNFVA